MGLLNDFNSGTNSEFLARVIAALVQKAKEELPKVSTALNPADKRKARTIRAMITSTPADGSVRGVGRVLVSQGITNASLDPAIQTEVTARFLELELLFDQTLDTQPGP